MKAVLRSWIGGTYRGSASDALVEVVNPSDAQDVVASVPLGSPDDVAAAVEAAHAAHGSWRRTTGPERAEALYRWASAIEERSADLASSLSREVGKPIGEARGEVRRCVVILRYYAGEAVRPIGEVVPAQAQGALQFTLRQPLGVVALITPWNFPLAIPLWKAAPALAFGNTVVLKPAPQASAVTLELAETAVAAGLPDGVFNVVLGGGESVGEPLLRADAIRGVSFTGSTTVGARVAEICARRNVPFQTEMGGKNVVIVMPDADLDLAARLTAAGAMRYAGQKCTATSRAVVFDSVEGLFIDRLRAQIDALPLGPVDNAASAVGPLINEAARDRVLGAVADAREHRLFGGERPSDQRFARGWFIEPAVLRDVPPDSPAARDELFGPVLATFRVADLDQAIALANRTDYGLSASIFTRDIASALDYIDRIQTGLVRVNGDTTGVDPHAPFGGLKASSAGRREQGQAAREFYTNVKTVQVNPA